MRSHAITVPFLVLAASSLGWHGCQPSSTGSARVPVSAAGSAAPGAACGITFLYQNNTNGEIDPCG